MLDTTTHAKAYWRGTLTCNRAAAMLDGAMAVLILQGHADIAAGVTLAQGSYRPWSKYSANTHAGCGVDDVSQWNAITGKRWTPAQFDILVTALRMVGFAAWHRALIIGLWVEHIHCVAIGCPDLNKPDATNQVTSYRNGHDGLADNGRDNGPRDWVNVTWETHQATHPDLPVANGPITTSEEIMLATVPDIANWYQTLCGRAGSLENLDYWWRIGAGVDTGVSMDAVHLRAAFARNDEPKRYMTAKAYHDLIGREAGPGEIDWQVAHNTTADQIRAGVANSAEARAHAAKAA